MTARTFLRALLCAAVFSIAGSAAAAEEAQAPLKIGIVGTGNIGGALAKHWAKAGHELVISSRHPEELQSLAKSLGPKVRVGTPLEAAQFGDVVLVSVPYKATAQVGQDLASAWKGKIVLDTGNPYPMRDGTMALDARKRGTGVTSKEFLPGVRLVRAFNAINWDDLANQGNHKPERYAIPLASDDAEGLKVAQRLVREAGFDPVVVGGLARAREFDVGTKVYTELLTAKQLREALGLK
ncbi:MAG TPA: NADPH-dependent F420 reductase [Steroidobacteraceae bacterium]|nr:NADPH-dependent F420 reductase [Steroidobacteraceae bacterium]